MTILSLVPLCEQSEIRAISVNQWGSQLGLSVLNKLSQLYCSLVWESTVLLSLCTPNRSVLHTIPFSFLFDFSYCPHISRHLLSLSPCLSASSLPPGCEFGQADMQKLVPKEEKPSGSTSTTTASSSRRTGNGVICLGSTRTVFSQCSWTNSSSLS